MRAALAGTTAFQRNRRHINGKLERAHRTQAAMYLPLEDHVSGQIELVVMRFQLENQAIVNQAPGRTRRATYGVRNGIIMRLFSSSVDIFWYYLQVHIILRPLRGYLNGSQ
jgi:hypothetical protein